MDDSAYRNLLLRSVFACMACDGTIDEQEIALIRDRSKALGSFGSIDLENELKTMVTQIREQGGAFIDQVVVDISSAELRPDQEIELLQEAIQMVEANEDIHYREVRLVKLMRRQLKASDEVLLSALPGCSEYLHPDAEKKWGRQLTWSSPEDDAAPSINIPDWLDKS